MGWHAGTQTAPRRRRAAPRDRDRDPHRGAGAGPAGAAAARAGDRGGARRGRGGVARARPRPALRRRDRGRRSTVAAGTHPREASWEQGVTHEIRSHPGMPAGSSAWSDLAGVGRDHLRGGYSRHAFDDAEMQLRQWFAEQAQRRGLEVENDRNGNVWAWWGAPAPGAVVTGSHLDSVPGGGAFDGPLGVVSGAAGRRRAAAARRHAGPAAGRRLLRRGGGRPVRPALPGIPADDRGGRRRSRPPAARCERGVGRGRGPAGRVRPVHHGTGSGAAGLDRDVRGTARRAGPAAAGGRRRRRRRRRIGDPRARPVADHRHRAGQPRRHHRDRRTARTR